MTRKRSGSFYDDESCFFRCIAYFFSKTTIHLDDDAIMFYKMYEKICHGKKLHAVTLQRLPHLEELFGTYIVFYSLEVDELAEVQAVKVRSSAIRFYKDHFYLITDLGACSQLLEL